MAKIDINGKLYDIEDTQQDLSQLTQYDYTDAVQQHLDSLAQQRGYDNVFTAISYLGSSDSVFAGEARLLSNYRDAVWRTCYNILDDVKLGKREQPSVQQLLDELPNFLGW